MQRTFSFFVLLMMSSATWADETCPAFLDYDLPRLHSDETVNICQEAAGKTLLVINTASHCGFTKQFTGLEAVHKQYKDKGLYVVGFASNDFNQEAKSEAEADKICRKNYGVTFTMVAPSPVKGDIANPVFQELNKQAGEPSWNFNKYLVSKDGTVIEHYSSWTSPDSNKVKKAIEASL